MQILPTGQGINYSNLILEVVDYILHDLVTRESCFSWFSVSLLD